MRKTTLTEEPFIPPNLLKTFVAENLPPYPTVSVFIRQLCMNTSVP